MIRILLVDDHELVRTGIRRLLEDNVDIRVVDEAKTGEEAVAMVRHHQPDLVLMDVNMPGIGGLEATRRISQFAPDLPVIILSVHSDDPFPSSLLKAGASGYLHKGCSVEEIIRAIKQVMEGGRYISPDIAQNMALSTLPGKESSPFDDLSQREMQVMLMLLNGNKVQDISEQLCLSPKTISTYRHRLFEKLNVRTDMELTRLAMHHGMLDGS